MRVLYAVSEVAGFAKTGGLADVAAALPLALAERNVECAVIMPLYRSIRTGPNPPRPTSMVLSVPMGERVYLGRVWHGTLPGSAVPIFFIEQSELLEKDDPAQQRGIYQYTQPDGQKADYADNSVRFGFFCRAVLEALPLLDFWPDVLHLNDWQTGLIPVYLREMYAQQARTSMRQRYQAIRTLLTIHNLAYQGLFWHFDMPALKLPWRLFNPDQLEFFGHVNFLKAGIVFSDLLTTVSPTYAKEIQTPYFGCGLQGVLLQRSAKLFGIVNGADYQVWNPQGDPHLPAPYDLANVATGKALCKAALQQEFGLEKKPRTPLLGMVSRLVDQKGLDILCPLLETLLTEDVQVIILGQGDPKYHDMLMVLQKRHPLKLGVSFALDERQAHLIEAGADFFLMPSQYEPCGLSQLYSLKYGTVPIVRATGGLADTVLDATPENLAQGKATGYVFVPYAKSFFREALHRALACYRQEPEVFRQIQATGMRQDWSWGRSAGEYIALYERLIRN